MKFCPLTRALCEHSEIDDAKTDRFRCAWMGVLTELLTKCPKKKEEKE